MTSTVPFRTSEGWATTLNWEVKWKGDAPAAAAPTPAPSSTVIVIVVGAADTNAANSDAEKMVLDFILKVRFNDEAGVIRIVKVIKY